MKLAAAIAAAFLAASASVAAPPSAKIPPAPGSSPPVSGKPIWINRPLSWPMIDRVEWRADGPEGIAASRQAWNSLASYVAKEVSTRKKSSRYLSVDYGYVGRPEPKVYRGNGKACGEFEKRDIFGNPIIKRPFRPAVLVDLATLVPADATSLGFPEHQSAPGAVLALSKVRDAGVTVIVYTDSDRSDAARIVDDLRSRGLGDYVANQSLRFPKSGPRPQSLDQLRADIGSRHCVIAIVGNDLGDFDDALLGQTPQTQLNSVANAHYEGWHTLRDYSVLWGNGWFLVPTPRYTDQNEVKK